MEMVVAVITFITSYGQGGNVIPMPTQEMCERLLPQIQATMEENDPTIVAIGATCVKLPMTDRL